MRFGTSMVEEFVVQVQRLEGSVRLPWGDNLKWEIVSEDASDLATYSAKVKVATKSFSFTCCCIGGLSGDPVEVLQAKIRNNAEKLFPFEFQEDQVLLNGAIIGKVETTWCGDPSTASWGKSVVSAV